MSLKFVLSVEKKGFDFNGNILLQKLNHNFCLLKLSHLNFQLKLKFSDACLVMDRAFYKNYKIQQINSFFLHFMQLT